MSSGPEAMKVLIAMVAYAKRLKYVLHGPHTARAMLGVGGPLLL